MTLHVQARGGGRRVESQSPKGTAAGPTLGPGSAGRSSALTVQMDPMEPQGRTQAGSSPLEHTKHQLTLTWA